MAIDTEAEYQAAFYRLCGTTSSDPGLAENGEATHAVANFCINHGMRAAQQFLIAHGMSWRWKKRSSALTTWTGTDAADGGRYNTLPTDFLRLDATDTRSALVEADGEDWGQYVALENGQRLRGDFYYLKNGQLWLSRNASVPATVYIDYVFIHPEFKASVTLDFPADAAGLVLAYAAQCALAEGWFPVAQNEQRLLRNIGFWEQQASRIARRDRNARKIRTHRAIGQWMVRR